MTDNARIASWRPIDLLTVLSTHYKLKMIDQETADKLADVSYLKNWDQVH